QTSSSQESTSAEPTQTCEAQSATAPNETPGEPDQRCNICFDWIRASGHSFGIQELCSHPFCAECILCWYDRPLSSCPVCRRTSERILVWPSMVESEEDKHRLINL